MNKNKLLSIIRLKGFTVTNFVKSLSNGNGVHMQTITFYRKINGDSDFSRTEIMAIAKVLHLSPEDIMSIFFTHKVA